MGSGVSGAAEVKIKQGGAPRACGVGFPAVCMGMVPSSVLGRRSIVLVGLVFTSSVQSLCSRCVCGVGAHVVPWGWCWQPWGVGGSALAVLRLGEAFEVPRCWCMRRPRGVTVIWGASTVMRLQELVLRVCAGAWHQCQGANAATQRQNLSSQGPSQGLAPAPLPCGCLSVPIPIPIHHPFRLLVGCAGPRDVPSLCPLPGVSRWG